ncbi:MAG: hypothetical protein ACTS22_06500 [Phycisphaerales bacterium]
MDLRTARRARNALGWGIASIVLFFVCLGPLAGLVGIPAVVFGSDVRRSIVSGAVDPSQAGGASAGFWLGWVTIGLSLFTLCLYGVAVVFLAAPLIPFGLGP